MPFFWNFPSLSSFWTFRFKFLLRNCILSVNTVRRLGVRGCGEWWRLLRTRAGLVKAVWLRRDVCYKEMRWVGRHKQAGPRARNQMQEQGGVTASVEVSPPTCMIKMVFRAMTMKQSQLTLHASCFLIHTRIFRTLLPLSRSCYKETQ